MNALDEASFNTDNGIRRATILRRMSVADLFQSFNTDNGIRRATMSSSARGIAITITASMFQYRQRYQEGYNAVALCQSGEILESFNTDNGIRRATIRCSVRCVTSRPVFQYRQRYQEGYNYVSSMLFTKFNSAFQYRQRYQEGYNSPIPLCKSVSKRIVSIPTTVSGGLQ